jgi:hypothetical protein
VQRGGGGGGEGDRHDGAEHVRETEPRDRLRLDEATLKRAGHRGPRRDAVDRQLARGVGPVARERLRVLDEHLVDADGNEHRREPQDRGEQHRAIAGGVRGLAERPRADKGRGPGAADRERAELAVDPVGAEGRQDDAVGERAGGAQQDQHPRAPGDAAPLHPRRERDKGGGEPHGGVEGQREHGQQRGLTREADGDRIDVPVRQAGVRGGRAEREREQGDAGGEATELGRASRGHPSAPRSAARRAPCS